MKKVFLLVALSIIGSMPVMAQELEKNVFNHLGVALEVGTTGIGLEVSSPMTDYFQVRAGASFMPNFKLIDFNVGLRNTEAWADAQAKFQQLVDNKDKLPQEQQEIITEIEQSGFLQNPLVKSLSLESSLMLGSNVRMLIDYLPFKSSSFRITAGLYYSFSRKIMDANTSGGDIALMTIYNYNEHLANQTFTATIDGKEVTYTFGDPVGVIIGGDGKDGVNVVMPNGPVVSGEVSVAGWRPYVGIGFGRGIPKNHRLGFACDLGVMFWQTPKITINNTTLQTSGISDDNGGNYLKKVDKLIFYPCLNFRLTGRIF